MKIKSVYLKAAKKIASGEEWATCVAIGGQFEYYVERQAVLEKFVYYFQPEPKMDRWWGEPNVEKEGKIVPNVEAQMARCLALLFMHEMTK